MKYFKMLTLIVFSSALFFYGCNDKSKAPKEETTKTVEVIDTTKAPETTLVNPPAKEPAQNTSGVWHYTCRIGCPGGAGSAVKCDTCGNTLVHNTTYHANTSNASTTAPFASPTTTATPPAKVPEPAQNTAGVWHYTCPQGHAGGAGSAAKCGTCQSTLTHNTAYH